MNILAHAILSPERPLVRVGNVSADFLKRSEEQSMNRELREGFELHHRIDTFTDRHPVVERAKARLTGYQRFANPVIDVVFDHFLVGHWPLAQSVESYVVDLHTEILENLHLLPDSAQLILRRMIQDEWLLSYFDLDGLELTFRRMASRIKFVTRRDVDLVGAVGVIKQNYDALEADFLEFWPELVQFVKTS